MQAKDIGDDEFVEVVERLWRSYLSDGRTFAERMRAIEAGEDPLPGPSVWGVAAVTGWPVKVVAAKGRRLAGRGRVDGCWCGCGTWITVLEVSS